jgi:Na+/melibiose symporter-like transporter
MRNRKLIHFTCLAPIVLMLTQSFTLDIFMFIVYGIGYGMYNGVLWAFVADVVDDLFANSREDEHALISNAKDMGYVGTVKQTNHVLIISFLGYGKLSRCCPKSSCQDSADFC